MIDADTDTLIPRAYEIVGSASFTPNSGWSSWRRVEAMQITPGRWLVRIVEGVYSMGASCSPSYGPTPPTMTEALTVIEAPDIEALRAMFFEEKK